MIQDVHPLSADQPVLVGEAFTLRYMPAREDLNRLEVFRNPDHPQRAAVEQCPPGAVMVMLLLPEPTLVVKFDEATATVPVIRSR